MKASSGPSENIERIEGVAERLGLDLMGTADLGDGAGLDLHETVRERVGRLRYAIVGGIRLSAPVLDTVIDAPTWTYYYHYRTVNFALDQAALRIAGEVQRAGHEAFPVPASQILDWDRLKGHLSHREVGGLAGLGWRGRNNLLVNPEYGSMCRYVTVLTDMPLPPGRPPGDEWGCGDCRLCVSACPVGAIGEDPGDFDLDRCSAQLRRFARSEKINTMICGLCVKVCKGGKARTD